MAGTSESEDDSSTRFRNVVSGDVATSSHDWGDPLVGNRCGVDVEHTNCGVGHWRLRFET
jgi:hypothetical protein